MNDKKDDDEIVSFFFNKQFLDTIDNNITLVYCLLKIEFFHFPGDKLFIILMSVISILAAVFPPYMGVWQCGRVEFSSKL